MHPGLDLGPGDGSALARPGGDLAIGGNPNL